MHKPVRYHIQLNKTQSTKGRTTISLDKIISDMIAIKLNATPDTKDAHILVRKQLQRFVNHDLGRSGHQLSRYITEQAILFISDKKLSEKYLDFVIDYIR